MVWDYPAALEVIRSEQAAGCVAAVLCGHAACAFEAPCHMLHPATAASWGGLSRDTLLSDPLRRSRLAAQGPARGCGAVVRPVRSRQIRGYPPPRPRPLRRVSPRRARRAPLYLLLAAQQVLTLLSSSGADLLLELTSSTLLAFCSPLNSTATHLPTALLLTDLLLISLTTTDLSHRLPYLSFLHPTGATRARPSVSSMCATTLWRWSGHAWASRVITLPSAVPSSAPAPPEREHRAALAGPPLSGGEGAEIRRHRGTGQIGRPAIASGARASRLQRPRPACIRLHPGGRSPPRPLRPPPTPLGGRPPPRPEARRAHWPAGICPVRGRRRRAGQAVSLTLTLTRTRTLTPTPTPTPTLSAGRHPRASAATQRASQSARKGDGSAVDVYCRNTFPIEVRYRLGSCVSSRARREIKRTTHFLSAHSPAERWWRSEAGWVGSWVGSCFSQFQASR